MSRHAPIEVIAETMRGICRGVPESVRFGGDAGFAAVIVEDYVQANGSCIVNDAGENVASMRSLAGRAGTDLIRVGNGIARGNNADVGTEGLLFVIDAAS